MQNDAEHFRAKMGKIEGSGNLGERLVELVQAKKTESPAPAPTPEKPKAPEPSDSTAEESEKAEKTDQQS